MATVSHLHMNAPAEDGVPKGAQYHKLVDIIRPPMDVFRQQLTLVANYADLRADRASEILDQVGYPTGFFATVMGLHPERHGYVMELVAACQKFASHVTIRVKHALACKRPDTMSAEIQPIIRTPAHGALPSGHSTEAFCAARVLLELAQGTGHLPDRLEAMLMAQAARIAINRTVAGVHFPADSVAGAMLGLALGEYFINRAGGGTLQLGTATFDGNAMGSTDFLPGDLFRNGQRTDMDGGIVTLQAGTSPVDVSAPLQWLWNEARRELEDAAA